MGEIVKVILISTDKRSNIAVIGKELRYSDCAFSNHTGLLCKYGFLYVVSDNEIEPGKEVYYIDKFTNKITSSGGAEYAESQNVIIATNDTELYDKVVANTNYEDADAIYNNVYIFKLPEEFIKSYVKQNGKI